MNTYDYMYSIGLRGTIEINCQQLMRLRDEGVPFINGYRCIRCIERDDLILECKEAMRLEKEISDIISRSHDVQLMYVTDIWKWKYLTKEYRVDIDGGVHFTNLIIYYKGEVEENDN